MMAVGDLFEGCTGGTDLVQANTTAAIANVWMASSSVKLSARTCRTMFLARRASRS
jgi:hypothetical protein